MKQVPVTDEELELLIKLLSGSVPGKDEESILFNLINRMKVIRRMT